MKVAGSCSLCFKWLFERGILSMASLIFVCFSLKISCRRTSWFWKHESDGRATFNCGVSDDLNVSYSLVKPSRSEYSIRSHRFDSSADIVRVIFWFRIKSILFSFSCKFYKSVYVGRMTGKCISCSGFTSLFFKSSELPANSFTRNISFELLEVTVLILRERDT